MNKTKSMSSRILSISLNIVLICMVLYISATLYLRASTGNPHASLFGITTHIVISESMEPNIHKNDIIIVKKGDEYQIGDIITYVREDGLSITHRIVSLNVDGYIVQGDANIKPDAEVVQDSQIVGKVIVIIPTSGK